MKLNNLPATFAQSLSEAQAHGVLLVNHWSVINLENESEVLKVVIKARMNLEDSLFRGSKYWCSIEISTKTIRSLEGGSGATLIESFGNALRNLEKIVKTVDVFVYPCYDPKVESRLTCNEVFNTVSQALKKVAEQLGIKRYLVVRARNI